MTNTLRDLVMSLRPWQWLKNVFVFTAVVLTGQLFVGQRLIETLVVFVAFCLLASAGYLLNDVMDRRCDQQHPVKCLRPIAAGRLPVSAAMGTSALLVGIGLILGFSLRASVGWTLVAYTALTIAYSVWVKEAMIIDVITVALGYVLRVIAGGFAVQAMPSSWALGCVFLLACLLSIGKRVREQEISCTPLSHRASLQPYAAHQTLLLLSVAAATIICYLLSTMALGHGGSLVWTVPCVVVGIVRYLYLIRIVKLGDAPDKLLVQDRPLLFSVVVWGVLAVTIFYQTL